MAIHERSLAGVAVVRTPIVGLLWLSVLLGFGSRVPSQELDDPDQARTMEILQTLEETAEVLNVGRTKVAGEWSFAKVWLARELS